MSIGGSFSMSAIVKHHATEKTPEKAHAFVVL
jgi:hypothetical protein